MKRLVVPTFATIVIASVTIPMTAHAETYVVDNVEEASDILKAAGITTEACVEGDYASGDWTYGLVYDDTGVRAITLGEQYTVEKETGTSEAPGTTDDTDQGTTIIPELVSDYTFELDTDKVGYGYHEFEYTPPDGTLIPIAYWTTTTQEAAVHSEQIDFDSLDVGSLVAGLIDPTTWGRWAYYHGVEFHSATSTVDMVAPYEEKSPCVSSDGTSFNEDYPTRYAISAIDGSTITDYCSYLPYDAALTMPILEQGQEYIYTCPWCGGLENQFYVDCTSTAISADKYYVMYNAGTSDPDVTGTTEEGMWYYDFATEYEGTDVESQDETVAETGYTRPGYTFIGWSTTADGDVEYLPGDSLEELQTDSDGNNLQDGDVITLYAVWGAQVGDADDESNPTPASDNTANGSGVTILDVDADSENNFNGTAKYDGESLYTTEDTLQIERTQGSDNEELDSEGTFTKNTEVISEDNVTLPEGNTITYDAGTNGGTVNGSDTDTETSTIYLSGYTADGLSGTISDITYDDDKLESLTYTYAAESVVDTVTLEYSQIDVTLPSATKDNALFIGWYTDSSCSTGCFVGTTGDAYTPTEDVTLYAKFSEIELDVEPVYYKTSTSATAESAIFEDIATLSSGAADNSASTPDSELAVNYATGAVNIAANMYTSYSYETAYKIFYQEYGDSDWTSIEEDGADALTSDDTDASYTSSGTSTYTVESTGFYKLTAYGAQGGSNGNYTGGYGSKYTGTFYLVAGDKVKVVVGAQGSTGQGGGYSALYRKSSGDSSWTLLMMAGGGGAASTDNNGNAETGSSYNSTTSTSGVAATTDTTNGGGGGGYASGQTGHAYTHSGTAVVSNGVTYYTSSGGSYTTATSVPYTASYTKTTTVNLTAYDGGTWSGSCQHCGNSSGTYYYGTVAVTYSGEVPSGVSNTSNKYVICPKCGMRTTDSDTTVYTANGLSGTLSTETITYTAYHTYYALSDTTAESGGHGGRSYIIASASTNSTSGNIYYSNAVSYGSKSGTGKVTITAVSTGLLDGSDNYVYINGKETPDTAAPDAIENLDGSETLTWDEPASNGTKYNFKSSVYSITSSGVSSSPLSSSSVITRTITSAIAGYYYVYDDSEDTDVSTYINALYTTPDYTWSSQHYSSDNVGFTQDTSLTTTDTEGSYIHIAAVDVAGNIGETTTRKVSSTNLGLVTFNTNKLTYQLDPTTTVSYGDYSPSTTTAASGQNAQGVYYQQYYSVDGTDVENTSNGKYSSSLTDLDFGGDFPTVTATGCTFLGWNSASDGSGTWYSEDGDGDGDTYSDPTTLVISDLTGSEKCGQKYTLYAIWSDDTTSSIIATYSEPTLSDETGVTDTNAVLYLESDEASITSGSTDWTSEVSVGVSGQSEATGTYELIQSIAAADGTNEGSVTLYTACKAASELAASLEDPLYTLTSFSNKQIAYAGTIQKSVASYYTGNNVNYDLGIQLQGTYVITGSAESRQYSSSLVEDEQGYPAKADTDSLTVKIDSTIPSIDSYTVDQDSLSNYSVDEVEDAIQNGLYTEFTATVSDYNDSDNGVYYDSADSSGIYGVYVLVRDIDSDEEEVYKMTQGTVSATTDNDDANILSASYSLSVNLYAEFPTASTLLYEIYAVDNAGNFSDVLDSVTTTDSSGNTIDSYPTGNVDQETSIGTSRGAGLLNNFSIKTVVYSDEDDTLNVAEGETYFQTGDIGHVECWTVGYTASVSLDFGDMGDEAVTEIEDGDIPVKYNLGIDDDSSDYYREIPYTVADEIVISSFTVYDADSQSMITVTASSDPDLYNDLAYDENGIPYAQHYSSTGWEDEGMSVRIPPYYQLTQDGDNVNDDGTPQYEWEIWSYDATAIKNSSSQTASSTYIIYDTRSNDVHYRVTHES